MTNTNHEFEITGLCHVALVCEDMERTVDFYTNKLGMKLAKTIEIPNGGQHFFFDMGCGEFVAFFWFANAPKRVPGVASPGSYPGVGGDIVTAHGSMNHLSFRIAADKFEEYVAKLKAKGVETGPILNHDDSERGIAPEMYDGVFMRSVYFMDPDGILLEFSALTRVLGDDDVRHGAKRADGSVAPLRVPAGVGA